MAAIIVSDQQAGRIEPTNSAFAEWTWRCSLCGIEGLTSYKDGAFANLLNHISLNHVAVVHSSSWVEQQADIIKDTGA